MQAILLHKSGDRTNQIKRGLREENIKVTRKIWWRHAALDARILDAAIIIIYCDSPDREIFRIIKLLRERNYCKPVIIIDENKNLDGERDAQSAGANGYFARPLVYRGLAQKIKELIAKQDPLGDPRWIRAFDIRLNVKARQAKRGDHTIPLCNREFNLLEFFMYHRGRVLTRSSLMESVWDRNAHFPSNTVDVHVNRLRKKIDGPFSEKLIHTVHCVGYIFEKRKK